MLPTFYQTHLQKQLRHAPFILLKILLDLIPSEKQVRLDRLLQGYFPIQLWSKAAVASRIRFLDLPQLTIARSLVPFNRLLVNNLLLCGTNSINCDRSYLSGGVSIFLRSLSIMHKRAIPLYWWQVT
jgi:hypothetical protein